MSSRHLSSRQKKPEQLNEYRSTEINGRPINVNSLEIGGLRDDQYPRFEDAYFAAGEFEDGEPMDDYDLDQATDELYWLLNELALENFQGQESDDELVSESNRHRKSILDILTPEQLEKVYAPMRYDEEAVFVDHEDVYDTLYDYYLDNGMPYGTAKGRTGDPDDWIEKQVWKDFGEEIDDLFSEMERKDRGQDLSELRKLAGLSPLQSEEPIKEDNEDEYLQDFVKFLNTVRSVRTKEQLKVAQRMGDNLLKKHTGNDISGLDDFLDRLPQVSGELRKKQKKLGMPVTESRLNEAEMITKRVIGHQDREAHMMQRELLKIRDYAQEVCDMLDYLQDGDFPHWWQAKLVKAGDYMSTIKHFLEGEQDLEQRAADKMSAQGIDRITIAPAADEVVDSLPPEDDDYRY